MKNKELIDYLLNTLYYAVIGLVLCGLGFVLSKVDWLSLILFYFGVFEFFNFMGFFFTLFLFGAGAKGFCEVTSNEQKLGCLLAMLFSLIVFYIYICHNNRLSRFTWINIKSPLASF